MDNRWFREDRKLDKDEQQAAIEESRKALMNSTLFRGRLEQILEEELQASYNKEEDFDDPNWERKHVAEVSRRKTLRGILKLIKM